ncbi:sigma-70 family RNA polymerase sigma factor [Methylobacterium flocculans]|jgi:RNA polymerase sigma-70 factor (ECF subfamily)|uniref:sigma-70 family RNA polymerase sigma factor n=1 Tax=Methylobacterium flocculans TaxID=2984843 RepID=UPI0021F2665C|nr:sigma-70 family RNA polymerase sigma factor [Methylobacterium sp. FF17]
MPSDAMTLPAEAKRHDPVLPLAVRMHLGLQLQALYGPPPELDEAEPIQALLRQLDAVLASQGEALSAEIRAGMTAQMPGLLRFALSLTKDRSRAEDLVQETLMRGWRSRHTYQPGTNLGAWLTMILRNTFYTYHRRRTYEVEDPDDRHAGSMTIAPSQEDGLHLQDMQAALAQLSAEHRETLVLIVLNDLSYEEAAVAMGCKVGTVKSRVSRARERLTHILGLEGVGWERHDP